MHDLSRQEVLNVLQGDWASYVAHFQRLTPEAQASFLAKQGYARFADLLSHIVAWWEAGYQAIEKFLVDPQFQAKDIDVDTFNAAAVAKTSGLDEDTVIKSFETMRSRWCEFVKALPETAFENEKVVKQFNMELVGHLCEHKIPERE